MVNTAYEVIEGLKIIQKYDGSVWADHDIIYAGNGIEESQLTLEERYMLEELNWHYEEGCGYAKYVC